MSTHNHTTSVEFREIPEAPGYRFYADGSVYSCWVRGGNDKTSRMNPERWRKLKTEPGTKGYPSVHIRWNGKWTCFPLHKLILTAFRGSRPEGMQCRHLDDNKLNIGLENLEWGTPAENGRDKVQNGRSTAGVRHPRAQVNDEVVREIRRLYTSGLRVHEIAKRLGLSWDLTSDVAKGKSWKHVT